MRPSFIYDPDGVDRNTITVRGAEARHMAAVLRLHQGDMVRLIDGQGLSHICKIVQVKAQAAVCRIIQSTENEGEPALHLTLAIGLSAGGKFDTVIEKGTEVGVGRFIPMLTSKAKVRLGAEHSISRKVGRWRRIAEAAAKQSGRSLIPFVETPVDLDQAIMTCRPSNTVMFHPGGKPGEIDILLQELPDKTIILLVGPESGFSPEEISLAEARGLPIVSLGRRILRTETAGIVLPALVIHRYEAINS